MSLDSPASEPDGPKSARIAFVCEREIARLSDEIARCASFAERSMKLRERSDIQGLLAFAVSQDDYQAWLAFRPDRLDGRARIASG